MTKTRNSMVKCFHELATKCGFNAKESSELLSVSRMTYYQWLEGVRDPNEDMTERFETAITILQTALNTKSLPLPTKIDVFNQVAKGIK